MTTRLPIVLLILASLMPACAFAQTATPPQIDPETLHAKDTHQNLLIAADPYLTMDRYKAAFGKSSPFESGIIAIQVYARNDNDAPVRVDFDTIELLVSLPGRDHQRLTPIPVEEVANRTLLKGDANPKAPSRLPLPGLGKGGPAKAWNEMVTLLHSVAFSSEVLPPHGSTHGFIFFDMNHNFDAIRYAHLYIPDLWFMTDKKALFFFEIDLGPSAPH
jgi:hypothetical protein